LLGYQSNRNFYHHVDVGKGKYLFAYIARRISVVLIILLGSSFFVYNLQAYAGDPREELLLSTDPARDQMIADLTRQLDLDTPPPLRYFKWLGGLLGVFTGNADLGLTRTSESVADAMSTAIPTTLRLVLAATFIAIFLGISIGMITALRQYSRFDYSITFVSFLFFSLPIFWVAVLLKQFLAIEFNNWLASSELSWQWVVGIGLVTATIWAGILATTRRKTAIVFVSAFAISTSLLTLLGAIDWFNNPGLGPIVIAGLGAGVAVGVTLLSTGLSNKPALYGSLGMAVFAGIIYYPLQPLLNKEFNGLILAGLALSTVGVGLLTGWLVSREDRGAVMRTTSITAVIVAGFILLDKLMQTWAPYNSNEFVSYRPIPTVGQSKALLQDQLTADPDFWMSTLDALLHLVLPTLALCIISFAGYVRYTRGSLLEVLNQDYIRTARAKGLNERTVIMRHAFRNAMIPLTTLVAWDIAGLIGGAIITERVFGWYGMGTLFNKAITTFDLNLLMGVAILTSFLAIMANLLADLIYSALDPRIRVR
jgi:peptide/nickel transport system permease protein